jgi:tetratricopeptide (TPR) repeat protein
MLVHALRAAAGVVDGEPEEESRDRLSAFVRRTFERARTREATTGPRDAPRAPSTPEAVDRVIAFVGELARVPFPNERHRGLARARADARVMGDAIRSAWLELMAAATIAQPVLVVLDDAHWGDRPSMELVEAALRTLGDRPIMALALGRPAVRDRFPRLWSDRHPQWLSLAPLGQKACRKLARALLGGDADASLIASVTARSDGNPFFLEELVRSVVRSGSDALPESLLAVVQARLDDLAPDTRRALRAASVFGQRFWVAGVAALLSNDDLAAVASEVELLVQHELVDPRQPSSREGHDELQFRHALIRDAAYEMLTAEDRTAAHRAAGDWLVAAGESDALVLAEHYARGEVPDLARASFLRAARQALDGDDPDEARRRAERGVALGAEGPQRGRLRLVALEADNWTGRYEESTEHGTEALALLPRGGAEWWSALTETAEAFARLGRFADVRALAAETDQRPDEAATDACVVALARVGGFVHLAGEIERASEIVERARALAARTPSLSASSSAALSATLALRAFYAGDLSSYMAASLDSARGFETVGDERRACQQRINVGIACVELGDDAAAREHVEVARSTADRLGLRWNEVSALQVLAAAHLRDDVDAAEDTARRAIERARALGSAVDEGDAHVRLAEVMLARDRVDEATDAAERALELLPPVPIRRVDAHALLARIHLARGDAGAAEAEARRACASGEEAQSVGPNEIRARLVLAEAQHARGEVEGARGTLDEAVRLLGVAAARIGDERWRTSFCERVPEHARILELARLWSGSGSR